MYTKVLVHILAKYYWPANMQWEKSLEQRVWLRVSDPYDFPYDPGAWPARGSAEFSLYVALYALDRATSFEEGIEIAVKVGGDTDTYAAIAGGLLGAKYGYEAIPKKWRETILGHDKMIELADALCLLNVRLSTKK